MNEDETVQEACEVPLDEQDEARERWKPLVNAVERVTELDDGYEFELPADSRWLEEGGRLLATERECCPFFRLELVSRADGGPVVVRFRSEEAMERGLDVEIAEIFG